MSFDKLARGQFYKKRRNLASGLKDYFIEQFYTAQVIEDIAGQEKLRESREYLNELGFEIMKIRHTKNGINNCCTVNGINTHDLNTQKQSFWCA